MTLTCYQYEAGLQIKWVVVQIKVAAEVYVVRSCEGKRILGSFVQILFLQIADGVHHWLAPDR